MRRALCTVLAVGCMLCAAAADASAQAGVSYGVPAGNPFVWVPGARPEVFHYGLRNPFRFSFDSTTGDLLVGDVGGGVREEVSRASFGQAGLNFGWSCREGTVAGPGGCTPGGAVREPLFDYANGGAGAAVNGGVVVHDSSLPSVDGQYLFGDTYNVFGDAIMKKHLGSAAAPTATGAVVDNLAAFGEDGNGKVHVASLNGGVHRLTESGGTLGTSLVDTFVQPIGIEAPAGDSRLFVPQLGGQVKVRVGTTVKTFLDLAGLVSTGGERGLLGLAFAPDYATSGRFYVFYTDNEPGDVGDLRLDEFRRSDSDPDKADPGSRRPVMVVEHSSASNHNGGQIHFGPDGLLYWSTGDGGSQGDPEYDAQNVGSLLGKILRIDPRQVSSPGGGPPGGGPPGGAPGRGRPAARRPAAVLPAPDQTPPRLGIRADRRQRILKNGGVVFSASCSERCVVRAGARLRIGRRTYTLKPAIKSLSAGTTRRVRSRLTRAARRALGRALRQRRRQGIRLTIRALDGAGNSTHLHTAGVRARR